MFSGHSENSTMAVPTAPTAYCPAPIPMPAGWAWISRSSPIAAPSAAATTRRSASSIWRVTSGGIGPSGAPEWRPVRRKSIPSDRPQIRPSGECCGRLFDGERALHVGVDNAVERVRGCRQGGDVVGHLHGTRGEVALPDDGVRCVGDLDVVLGGLVLVFEVDLERLVGRRVAAVLVELDAGCDQAERGSWAARSRAGRNGARCACGRAGTRAR